VQFTGSLFPFSFCMDMKIDPDSHLFELPNKSRYCYGNLGG
jgi:hypothetical protein